MRPARNPLLARAPRAPQAPDQKEVAREEFTHVQLRAGRTRRPSVVAQDTEACAARIDALERATGLGDLSLSGVFQLDTLSASVRSAGDAHAGQDALRFSMPPTPSRPTFVRRDTGASLLGDTLCHQGPATAPTLRPEPDDAVEKPPAVPAEDGNAGGVASYDEGATVVSIDRKALNRVLDGRSRKELVDVIEGLLLHAVALEHCSAPVPPPAAQPREQPLAPRRHSSGATTGSDGASRRPSLGVAAAVAAAGDRFPALEISSGDDDSDSSSAGDAAAYSPARDTLPPSSAVGPQGRDRQQPASPSGAFDITGGAAFRMRRLSASPRMRDEAGVPSPTPSALDRLAAHSPVAADLLAPQRAIVRVSSSAVFASRSGAETDSDADDALGVGSMAGSQGRGQTSTTSGVVSPVTHEELQQLAFVPPAAVNALHVLDDASLLNATPDGPSSASPEVSPTVAASQVRFNASVVEGTPADVSVRPTPRRRKTVVPDSINESLSFYGRIGAGAVGDVYQVLDLQAEEECAAKVVPREHVRYMPTGVPVEAAAMTAVARVGSPHIVRLREVVDDPSNPNVYFVMDIVGPRATPLGCVDSVSGALTQCAVRADEVACIARQLGEAFTALRQQLVAHGDVKLDNILVTRGDSDGQRTRDTGSEAQHTEPRITVIDFSGAHVATRRFALFAPPGSDVEVRRDSTPANVEHAASFTSADPKLVAATAKFASQRQGSSGSFGATVASVASETGTGEATTRTVPSFMSQRRGSISESNDHLSDGAAVADALPAQSVQHVPETLFGDADPLETPAALGAFDALIASPSHAAEAVAPAQYTTTLESASDDDVDVAMSLASPHSQRAHGSSDRGAVRERLSATLRQQTIAVTLFSPALGPQRNPGTRRQLSLQRRRMFGRTTTQAGAVAYTAPEVLAGATPSPAADMWSVGVVLFAVVFERMPFHGATRLELERCIADDAPDFPPHADLTALQRHWKPLIAALLDKEPFLRPHPRDLCERASSAFATD